VTDRLVVGISGATGICYGVRVLELARKAGVETHLVETPAGQQTRAHETSMSARDLAGLADVCYRPALVPATAEIIVEGHIAVDETVMEGPMNEFPGYNATEKSPKAVFHVSAITYRDGATLPVVAAGPPVEEDHTIIGTMGAAEIVYAMRQAGLPVASAWCPFDAAVHWLVLAVEPDWHDKLAINAGELAKRIADVLFSGKPGINAPKTLLVENDVDITDLGEVVWAFATRSHPEHGEFHFPSVPSDQLAVYLDEQEAHSFQAGKVIHNCLLADRFPAGQRPVKGTLENGWPDDIHRRVLANWNTYGFSAGAGDI
jgi:4-hydroxy-3-polyprenylbenzoate decarboxylase